MTTTRNTMLAAALCFAGGCAATDDTPVAGGEEAIRADYARTDTIHGTDLLRNRLTSGKVILSPIDLSATAISALVERKGGFDTFPGSGAADGTFQIPGVPHGAATWIRVGRNNYLTSERVVEVGVESLGRPDTTKADPGTSLVFDLSNVAPVTASDDFQIESADAQIGFYSTASAFNPIIANAPAPGATSLDSAVFPFGADATLGTSQFPLIQASLGDTVTLAQLTPITTNGLTYLSAQRAFVASVEMTQGAATTLDGAMISPPTTIAHVDFRQDTYEGLADEIHPGSVPIGASILIDASPAQRHVNIGTPDLVSASLPAGNGDQVLPFELRDPYPASWPLYALATVSFHVPIVGVAADGSAVTRQTTSNELTWELLDDQANVHMVPAVSPVRHLSIDGQAASQQIQSAGATPVLSWDAPRRGQPEAYFIRVVHVIPTAPFIAGSVGRLVVRGDVNRLRVPAGLMQPGEAYYFQVISVGSAEHRAPGTLEALILAPHGQFMDAFSGTMRVQ